MGRAISGVAVVDAQGALVAATSGKDLALFLQDHSVDLPHLSILEYLGLHQPPPPLVKVAMPCVPQAAAHVCTNACLEKRPGRCRGEGIIKAPYEPCA